MKVLITGSNGFLGSHLTDILCNRKDYSVLCMCRKTSDMRWLKGKDIRTVFADLRDYASLEKALKDVDVIYHAGGIVRAVSKRDLYIINSRGTENLVNAVKKYAPNFKKFVYISSQAAWGPEGKGPVSDYGKSKKQGENAVKTLPRYSIVRPAVVYGPRDRDFLDVFKSAARGVFLRPTCGGRLSFVHVKDCVRIIVESKQKEVFASDGKSYSWRDIKEILQKVVGRRVFSLPVPPFCLQAAGFASSVVGVVSGKAQKFNSDKAREILAGRWVIPPPPAEVRYKLEDGFRDTWEWYKKNKWI